VSLRQALRNFQTSSTQSSIYCFLLQFQVSSLSLSSCSTCLRLLPHLTVTSIPPLLSLNDVFQKPVSTQHVTIQSAFFLTIHSYNKLVDFRSEFSTEYHLLLPLFPVYGFFLKAISSFLSLLPRLPVPSIFPLPFLQFYVSEGTSYTRSDQYQ
jgi:hypothetical protein